MRGPGVWVSRTQAIVIIVLFVCIVVGVGLLVGLIRSSCPSTEVGGTTTSTSAVLISSSPEVSTTPPGEDGPWRDPFLSNNTYPIHYDLWFYPDFYFDGGTFTGRGSIHINITDPTKYLIVHYKMMNMTSTKVMDGESGRELGVERAFPYDENQYWVTELEDELPKGSVAVLHLGFDGSLLNGIVGYYKSTYINSLTGKESWLATTKFQPTDARKAFPNFDEPKFKSTFTVTLKHWSNFTALGNMPNQNVAVSGVWTETTFQETPPMSSYLVCFIVCDFESKTSVLADGKPHRVWARPDLINHTDYALLVGTNITNFYAAMTGQNFHLPKLDHVAVPDYPSGATEHWGLITYREARLMYDEKTVSSTDKEAVASIIAHELSHNYFGNLVTNYWWDEVWLNEGFASYYEVKGVKDVEPAWQTYFGNLVTCHWWDDLWLNEGFARYYQIKGVADVEPTWQLTDGFGVSTMQGIMTSDATPSSRPVFLPVVHPDEINQAFSGIVYNKGAAVLRMMEDIFGEDVFKMAIQRYLRDRKYQTATTPDLWKAFQDEVGDSMNVADVMDPWVYQMGFPVIDITTPSTGRIMATPRRFMSNPSDDVTKPKSPFNYKWFVSLSYQTSNRNGRAWLNKSAVEFPDPRSNPDADWIMFNRKQAGYYRVNYPLNMWNQLTNQLQEDHEVLEPADRAGLMNDAFNLARAAQLDYQVALNMTRYLAAEKHYFPWHSVKVALDYIGRMMYGNHYYDLWRKYIRDTTTTLMAELQVVDQGEHLDKLLRNDIIKLSCDHGNKDCIKNITVLFKGWIGGDSVAPNIKSNVYRFGMQYSGTETDWQTAWDRYTDTSGPEKSYILYALSQTQTPWLIQKYLGNCMDTEQIRTQDFFTAVRYVASNPAALGTVWTWARANYDTFIKRFGLQDRYFGSMIPGIVAYFKTEYHLKEVEDFFAKYPNAGAGAAPRQRALDAIRDNIEWRQDNEGKVIDWLQSHLSL